jgi:hypothetical protein
LGAGFGRHPREVLINVRGSDRRAHGYQRFEEFELRRNFGVNIVPMNQRTLDFVKESRLERAPILVIFSTCFIAAFAAINQVAVGQATSPDRTALVEQALSEPTRIMLEDVKLGDALRAITEQTGVDIVMSPGVMALVPGGSEVVIQKVEIANIPLREGLIDLFSPLGMTFVVVGTHVEVIPTEAIRCLGRAPTWEELETLDELRRMNLSSDASAIDAMKSRVQFQVRMPNPWPAFAGAMRDVGVGWGEEVLTIACDKFGWAWCLSGRNIVITQREQEIIRRLQRPISLRMARRPLYDVMLAVGEAAGVKVRAEPGALASLPVSTQRNFTLEVGGQSAEQALETIAAYTGLGFLIDADGVVFFQASTTPTPDAVQSAEKRPPTGSADPYVGKVVVPLGEGASVEWLIRWSELPPDLRERRTSDLQSAFDAIRATP